MADQGVGRTPLAYKRDRLLGAGRRVAGIPQRNPRSRTRASRTPPPDTRAANRLCRYWCSSWYPRRGTTSRDGLQGFRWLVAHRGNKSAGCAARHTPCRRRTTEVSSRGCRAASRSEILRRPVLITKMARKIIHSQIHQPLLTVMVMK